MDMENLFEDEAHFASEEDVNLKQKWNSMTVPSADSEDDGTGGFDCNICFDSAHDPVVTLCGHLYCWPCIYKWLNVKTSSPDADYQQPSCPICKASISPNTLVPLYGPGRSSESETKRASLESAIPRRPPPSALNSPSSNSPHQISQTHPNIFPPQSHSIHHRQFFHDPNGGYAAMASSGIGGTTMTFNPMIGQFGEMVFARIFGSSDPSLFTYPFPNSYHLIGSNNPRVRRQEMQLDRSLNRITVFLLCCIFSCLILF